jgi:hypothetical protein
MKKRVHELAKQLKEHGIEFSNQVLVEKLLALGYSVKSHSSSLDFEEADAALRTILAEKSSRSTGAPSARARRPFERAASPGPSEWGRAPEPAQPARVSRPVTTRATENPAATIDGADHAPSLSAAMTATRNSLGRFLQLRMQAAFGNQWESLLLDERREAVRVPIDARGHAHWDWTALSAAVHALVKTKHRSARLDQGQFKLFMSLKNFRDKREQHPSRAVGRRELQLALEDMIELLDSIGDAAGADRVRRIPVDL